MGKEKNKLTPKQEKFCQLVVELGNQSEAYKQSYDVKPDTRPETHYEEASKLCATPNISTRIAEIRAELAKANIMSKEAIMGHLADIMNMTKHTEKEKAIALKAIDQYTKMMGGYEPVKHEVKQDWNISFGGEEDTEEEDES